MIRKALLALSLLPLAANAGWSQQQINDPSQPGPSTAYTQPASPIGGHGPELQLMVIDSHDGEPAALLNFADGGPDSCQGGQGTACTAKVRFDQGATTELKFLSDNGRQLAPTDLGAFTGALLHARSLTVEVAFSGKPMRYRYDLAPLNIEQSRPATVTVMGFDLGRAYPDKKPALSKGKSANGSTCYDGKNVANALAGNTAAAVTLCFYKDVLYSALVTPGSERSYNAAYTYFSERFGEPPADSPVLFWPDVDTRINRAQTKVIAFTSEDGTFDSPFIITDQRWSLLAPPVK
ncbi:hypothetical protein [Pseudomonas cremoricolorata]|uniref:hypothetical protein n=1 Tax=Pseudomonas cremoricolorata TaxID=157783 RepID=UPI00040C7DF9|nr:hypothetical protein [Pseudomonas cremoricolorata]